MTVRRSSLLPKACNGDLGSHTDLLPSGGMPNVRVQVSFPSVAGDPKDAIVNTWHFFADAIDEGTRAEIKAALAAFYEGCDAYKSILVAWNLNTTKIYDLSQPEPRTPVDVATLAVTGAPSVNSLPRELAVCVSFKTDYESGVENGRRRGRIFFGPLNTAALGSGGEIASGARGQIAASAGVLRATSDLAADWSWSIYSRAANATYPVVGGWVDDEFDIQRRRQPTPTTRSTF